MADDDALIGGRLAGRYRIVRRLEAGGNGVVYEALQEDLGRRVAVKVLSDMSSSPRALARFRIEAETAASLGHPHIVQVTDFQSNPPEPPFLVMELLAGQSLRELLKSEGTVAWQRAARIGLQILAALGAAHAAKIVHRDIKPANVFIVKSVAVADFVKVLDFGIAKLLEPQSGSRLTQAGAIVGTVAYMAPEQARGQEVDARSDLYSAAVCLYELVSGHRPIEAPPAYLRAAIATAEPVPVQTHAPEIDAGFAAILTHALQRDPSRRFQTATEMADALARIVGVDVPFAPETRRDSAASRTSMPLAPSPGQPDGGAVGSGSHAALMGPTMSLPASGGHPIAPGAPPGTALLPAAPAMTAAHGSVAWSSFERGSFGASAPPAFAPLAFASPAFAPPAFSPVASRPGAPPPRRASALWWLVLVPVAGLFIIGALVALVIGALGFYNADLKKFVATVQPTPCPPPARCVGKITIGDQDYAMCSPAAPATYREGDLLFVKRSGEDLPFVLVSNPDGRAMTGRSYQNEPEKFGADDVVGRYCVSASPSTSANPSPTSAISAETAAPSANLACEVTKRTHTCQAAAGPMLACTATSRLPWERKVVNGAFNLLSATKPAVDACGKVAGGQAGTYVVSGLVDDPQPGPRMNMKPKKGSGPTADCLAKALSITLPAAPRGDDDPPASLTLNYAVDVTVDCK